MTNPWSEAAASAKANNHNVSSRRREQCSTSRGLFTLRFLVKSCHILDAFVGIILTIYGLVLLSTHLYLPICLLLGMGVLLCIRSLIGLSALLLVEDDYFMPFGLYVSGAYLSPLVGLFLFAITFMCRMTDVIPSYLHQHYKELHLPSSWFVQEQHHAPYAFLWIPCFMATLVELLRWYMVPKLYQWSIDSDTQQHMDSIVMTTTTPITTTPRKTPWWWQSQTITNDGGGDLQDPLLLLRENDEFHWASHNNTNQSYAIHYGGTPSQPQDTSSSFWSKWFSGRKEDLEVSFQSVQEEWASKSEEDPLWWSRDEQQDEQPSSRTEKRESWTNDTLNQENTSTYS